MENITLKKENEMKKNYESIDAGALERGSWVGGRRWAVEVRLTPTDGTRRDGKADRIYRYFGTKKEAKFYIKKINNKEIIEKISR